MKSLCLAALCLLLALPAGSQEASLIERSVPSDCALLITVERAPSLMAKWDRTSLKALWDDPQIAAFCEPLRQDLDAAAKDLESLKELNPQLESVMDLFPGRVLIAIPNFEFEERLAAQQAARRTGQKPEVPAPPILVMADVKGQAPAITKLMANWNGRKAEELEPGQESKISRRDIAGVQAVVEEVVDADGKQLRYLGMAVAADTWVVASREATLADALTAVQAGGLNRALPDNPRFQSVRREFDGDALAYFDLQPIAEIIRAGIASSAPPPQGDRPPPYTVDSAAAGLGLDGWRAVYLGLKLEPDYSTVQFGLHYEGRNGLMRLVDIGDGQAKLPDYLPAYVYSATAANVNFPGLVADLKKTLSTISPQFGMMVNMQLNQMTMQTQVDIERQVIGNLAGSVVIAQAPRLIKGEDGRFKADGQNLDTLVVLGLNDPKVFETAVQGLMAAMAPQLSSVPVSEEGGQKVYALKSSQAGGQAPPVHYAFTDGALFVGHGDVAYLNRILNTRNSTSTKRFVRRADVQQVLKDLPADAWSLQVSNVGRMAAAALEQGLQDDTKLPRGADGKLLVNPKAKPDPAVVRKYLGLSGAAYRHSDNGMLGVFRLANSKAED